MPSVCDKAGAISQGEREHVVIQCIKPPSPLGKGGWGVRFFADEGGGFEGLTGCGEYAIQNWKLRGILSASQ